MKLKDYRKKILRTLPFRVLNTLLLRIAFFIWWQGMRFTDHDYPELANHNSIIYIGWHENIITLVLSTRREIKNRHYKKHGYKLYGLSSSHPDSKLLSGVYRRYGLDTVYGSSRRGGSTAVIELIGLLKKGNSTVISPDGPRGPRREMKEGALYIAMKTGSPIVPLGIAITKEIRMHKSWDNMCLPKLVWRNHMHVVWGKPLIPTDKITPQNRSQILQKLNDDAQKELDNCTKQAEEYALAEQKGAQ